jgi:membrane protein DedA with SNARE-associated domain
VPLAVLIHIPTSVGYFGLAVLIGAESMGVPLPGETALVTAAAVSQNGTLHIEFVIVAAAIGAIVGDNIGYLIGRGPGRKLMERPGRGQERRLRTLRRGEDFFERHGPKAVFLGRFVALLRIWASWIAGMTGMPWRSFLLWNALGGIVWATAMGLLGYLAGKAAGQAVDKLGVFAAVGIGLTLIGAYFYFREREPAGE